MYNIIGISGKKRAGKDTAAKYLATKGYEVRAFATPLKAALLALNPLVEITETDTQNADDSLDFYFGHGYFRVADIVSKVGYEVAKEIAEVRRLLQYLGTEAGRDIHGENLWVGAFNKAWEEDEFLPAVVSDVRFPNEAEYIRSRGGIVINITKDTTTDDLHTSESGLCSEYYNYLVTNNGSLTELYNQLDEIVQ